MAFICMHDEKEIIKNYIFSKQKILKLYTRYFYDIFFYYEKTKCLNYYILKINNKNCRICARMNKKV